MISWYIKIKAGINLPILPIGKHLSSDIQQKAKGPIPEKRNKSVEPYHCLDFLFWDDSDCDTGKVWQSCIRRQIWDLRWLNIHDNTREDRATQRKNSRNLYRDSFMFWQSTSMKIHIMRPLEAEKEQLLRKEQLLGTR